MSEKEQAQSEIVDEEVVVEEVAEAETVPATDEKYDELNNRYIRLLADFDNYKRRTANEKNDIYKYGTMNLVKEILPVLDSLELAFKNVPQDSDQSFVDGIEKVKKQLLDVLAKDGLERIEAMGVQYDPVYHEAIMVVEDDSAEPNTIIDELRAGYKYKDKVIRPTVCRVTSNK